MAEVIDVHAHWLPRWRGEELYGGPAPAPALHDLDAHLAEMDALGIGRRVVSPPPQIFESPAPENDRRMNEEIAAAVGGRSDRLVGLGGFAGTGPAEAAAELRRAVRELGLKGLIIGSRVGGRELDDPSLDAFWAAAEEQGALLLLHPAEVAGGDRMDGYHLRNLVGNPLSTALAAARIVFGGVWDRFPGLRIVLSHGGGALAWIAPRLDHGHQVRPECAALPAPPSSYLPRFHYDTIVFEPRNRRFLAGAVGAGRLVYGTDAPFDMSDPGGAAEADHDTAAALLA